jgi:uncharacterized protein (DUF1786 family)
MRILAIDIGTGTQDILVYDSSGPVENSPKLVMPSPTVLAEQRIREATRTRTAVVITGVLSGGGPVSWALGDHIAAGLAAYATPGAARTFNDDLARVEADGVTLVGDDEAVAIGGVEIRLRDLDMDSIRTALDAFGAGSSFDGLALGVLDHGDAPPGVSDRIFRFQHIERVLSATPDVRAFAFLPGDLPHSLTRARAVLDSVDIDVPTVFMDTGSAAALGVLHDGVVASSRRTFVLNAGNMHALGFVLDGTTVQATFEHHTGEISTERLVESVGELCAGTLTSKAVFESKGHGAIYIGEPPFEVDIIGVTGPRRSAVLGLLPDAHAAAPHGDMMLSGCFGLLDGFAYRVPEAREAVAALHAGPREGAR